MPRQKIRTTVASSLLMGSKPRRVRFPLIRSKGPRSPSPTTGSINTSNFPDANVWLTVIRDRNEHSDPPVANVGACNTN